jgi:hypothetical protein
MGYQTIYVGEFNCTPTVRYFEFYHLSVGGCADTYCTVLRGYLLHRVYTHMFKNA